MGDRPDDVTDAEWALRRPMTTRTAFVMSPRADTPQVSALQLLPLLPIVITFIGTLPSGWSLSTLAAGIVVTDVIQFLVARADGSALGRRGFVDQAPAALAFVSSALYLAVRARRCEDHDPSARSAATWAIGVTVAAVTIAIVATLFVWAINGGLAAFSDAQ